VSFAFYSVLSPQDSVLSFPCRSNSPSTAAAPPPAAANTANGCAKMPFFRFLPQLSSPQIADFRKKGCEIEAFAEFYANSFRPEGVPMVRNRQKL
jgi:hypothetical protein